MLYGGVEVGGYSQYFSGKASTMAGGAASATATDDILEPPWTSNTFAVGELFGDASVTGTGYAEGYTDIESVNLVDVTGGFIGISSEYGIPLYDANISLPDLQQNVSLPEFPSDIITVRYGDACTDGRWLHDRSPDTRHSVIWFRNRDSRADTHRIQPDHIRVIGIRRRQEGHGNGIDDR
jgi:hypothetical protein